jgi:uncharacterized protein YciW
MAVTVLTGAYIVKFQYRTNGSADKETPMLSSPELVNLIQRERLREADRSRLASIAQFARRCCEAPSSALDRLARSLRRPATQCC